MKFVKRISLFFIYPLTMFGLGFGFCMMGEALFYPTKEFADLKLKTEKEQELEFQETVMNTEPVITADTSYVVICYDRITGEMQELQEKAPDKYIGFTRQKLKDEIEAYEESPSLTDLEKGFEDMELVSFAPEKVVVQKSYESEKETGFFLVNEDHYVVVYDEELMHRYMNTGILMSTLPEELQEEILYMKFIKNEDELYHFLESYSS